MCIVTISEQICTQVKPLVDTHHCVVFKTLIWVTHHSEIKSITAAVQSAHSWWDRWDLKMHMTKVILTTTLDIDGGKARATEVKPVCVAAGALIAPSLKMRPTSTTYLPAGIGQSRRLSISQRPVGAVRVSNIVLCMR